MPKHGSKSKPGDAQHSNTSASCHDPRVEAAHKRICESASQADALEAIREIVTNLLGCEEIGLFAMNQRKSELFWSFGIDPEHHATLDIFGARVLEHVRKGQVHIVEVDHAQGHHGAHPLRVFVPIRLKDRTVAVLVMLKLLPQKLGLDEADMRLVQVISEESGKALFDRSAHASA